MAFAAPVTVIGGATGTGKTELALDLADALAHRGWHPHILNADALQRYRGMDIGTAKLPVEARRGHPHHQFDVLDLTDTASVAEYQSSAREEMLAVAAQDARAHWIMVGGTGLYINAVVRQLDFPGTDPRIRQRYEQLLDDKGARALHALLQERDPAAAAALDYRNTRKVVRALEVGELTGRPFEVRAPNAIPVWAPHTMIVLNVDRDVRAERLRARAQQMWEQGLLDEVRMLIGDGLRESPTARFAIGYAQALNVLDGLMTRAEALDDMSTATIRYAKRQDTWFRRTPDAHVIDATDRHPLKAALSLLDMAL